MEKIRLKELQRTHSKPFTSVLSSGEGGLSGVALLLCCFFVKHFFVVKYVKTKGQQKQNYTVSHCVHGPHLCPLCAPHFDLQSLFSVRRQPGTLVGPRISLAQTPSFVCWTPSLSRLHGIVNTHMLSGGVI